MENRANRFIHQRSSFEIDDESNFEKMDLYESSELHIAEEWFHGKIDRDEAKHRLLAAIANDPTIYDGLFLVRESETFVGDFTLSFANNGIVHHCRIKTSLLTNGVKLFYLQSNVKRNTLYELISFYAKHPLDTNQFKVSYFCHFT